MASIVLMLSLLSLLFSLVTAIGASWLCTAEGHCSIFSSHSLFVQCCFV
ncbi:hypothetical protein GLYMA_16G127251v4 [Glycine max]|nr:hypothetical protein GLYMA_16G127251v4 [Glycine max]KAH1151221.1 hypothetical protein GYH30_044948 [Glycine max]